LADEDAFAGSADERVGALEEDDALELLDRAAERLEAMPGLIDRLYRQLNRRS